MGTGQCGASVVTAQQSGSRADFDLPSISAPGNAGSGASYCRAAPLAEALERGLVVIQYRADNLRIVPIFGPAALSVARIGHIHVTVDDASWHWVDASGEPLIIQGLTRGPHRALIDLADPMHRVIDSKTVSFEICTSIHPAGK